MLSELYVLSNWADWAIAMFLFFSIIGFSMLKEFTKYWRLATIDERLRLAGLFIFLSGFVLLFGEILRGVPDEYLFLSGLGLTFFGIFVAGLGGAFISGCGL